MPLGLLVVPTLLALAPLVGGVDLPGASALVADEAADRPRWSSAWSLAAGAVVLAGVRGRLAAPVAVGSAVLGAHGVVQLGPWLLELGTSVPRWTALAVAGAFLLLEGATYERQVTGLRAAAARLAALR